MQIGKYSEEFFSGLAWAETGSWYSLSWRRVSLVFIGSSNASTGINPQITHGSFPSSSLRIRYLSFPGFSVLLQAKIFIQLGIKGKGKMCPATGRILLTFQDYNYGRSSAKSTDRLYPRRNPWYSLSEAESTSGHMVLSRVPRKKSPVTPPGIDPKTSRLVAQRLNHYATPGPIIRYYIHKTWAT